VPKTKKSSFDLPTEPDRIVLYQKNKAACSNEAEVREQIRLTVIHELGPYFGTDENPMQEPPELEDCVVTAD
jgi:predicted Zn-dependent protease with MMP-like domain